jgi:hypothetical protein
VHICSILMKRPMTASELGLTDSGADPGCIDSI